MRNYLIAAAALLRSQPKLNRYASASGRLLAVLLHLLESHTCVGEQG